MYNVLFENSSGQLRIIGTVENEKTASKVINDFLNEHNYNYNSKSDRIKDK